MKDDMKESILQISSQLAAHTLPRWHELPDLALYMDQVVALVGRYLGGYPGQDAKGLTASMVNNYVKLGIMPAPVKKKYSREHLAYLIIICTLKASLPIAAIRQLMAASLESMPAEMVYDRFCELFESTNAIAAESAEAAAEAVSSEPLSPIFRAALRAQAEQAMAVLLVEALSSAGTDAAE